MVEDELAGAGEDMGAPKGNMKTIIIIAVIAVVMAAIGFLAGKMFSGGGDNGDKPPLEQKTDAQTQQADTKTGQGAQKSTNGGSNDTADASGGEGDDAVTKKDERGVLALDTFTVNLNDPFGRRYIEVIFNLVVDKKSLVPKIKENELVMPKIRHEIFMTVSSKSYAELKSTSGKVTLAEEIMMRVNEILKEEMGVEPIIEVLNTKFLIQ